MTATVNATPSANGRPRRSLNETIEKLDSMLDGLSTAIPETIRDELRVGMSTAVAEGVRAALIEIFASPDVQAALHGMAAPVPMAVPVPAPPRGPNAAQQVVASARHVVTTAGQWIGNMFKSAAAGVAKGARRFGRWVKSIVPWISTFRRPLLIGLGVGVVVSVVAAVAPGWVGATLSGIGAACTVVAVHLGLWVRRLFGYTLQTE